ncbi:unnamed protein product [Gadus morhua 'NCC']
MTNRTRISTLRKGPHYDARPPPVINTQTNNGSLVIRLPMAKDGVFIRWLASAKVQLPNRLRRTLRSEKPHYYTDAVVTHHYGPGWTMCTADDPFPERPR